MNIAARITGICVVVLAPLAGQTAVAPLTPQQVVEQARPSVAMVIVTRSPSSTPVVGSGVVVSPNGVLLTSEQLLKDAYAVQVRFKDGEIFDDVSLVGVDLRRGVAAIRVASAGLVARPVPYADQAKEGDKVTLFTHTGTEAWLASEGTLSSYAMADQLGVGNGFKVLQFTSPPVLTSSGGVLFDSSGRALGIIVAPQSGTQAVQFAIPVDSVIGIGNGPVLKRYASAAKMGAPATVSVVAPSVSARTPQGPPPTTPGAPERSDLLANSRDRDFIARNIKTMFIDAHRANFFSSDQLRAQFGRNKGFAALDITIVEDQGLADAVLEVGYTGPWDFPFTLKHQNTSIVLLSGKGIGPLSGILGAANVASEFVKTMKPYRTPQKKK